MIKGGFGMRLIYLKKNSSKLLKFTIILKNILLSKVNFMILKNNTLNLLIEKQNINFILKFFKLNKLISYRVLTDIIAVDYPKQKNRFKLVYSLLSNKNNMRIHISLLLKEGSYLSSVKKIFSSASWLEREV